MLRFNGRGRSGLRKAAAFVVGLALLFLAGCMAREQAPAGSAEPPPAPQTAPPPPPPPPPPAPEPSSKSPPSPSAVSGESPPAGAGGCLTQAMAPFPWPQAPQPTATRLIVRDYLKPLPATLGEVLALLRSEVAAAGYPLPAVLGAGCSGFALILEGERVKPDGSRMAFQEWNQRTRFTIADILRQLWTAEPGYYRMIVLVVAAERQQPSQTTIGARELSALAGQGSSGLPAAMAALPFSPDYEVRALVYEFVKDSSGAEQVPPDGRIPVLTHLKSAGLLPSNLK